MLTTGILIDSESNEPFCREAPLRLVFNGRDLIEIILLLLLLMLISNLVVLVVIP